MGHPLLFAASQIPEDFCPLVFIQFLYGVREQALSHVTLPSNACAFIMHLNVTLSKI